MAALLSGGAIPDTADYQVRLEPEGTLVGTVNEDWAVESNRGDVFQLGNASWSVLRIEPGIVRVADAKGHPPSIPFWLGEAPGRTRELSSEIADLREEAGAAAAPVAFLTAQCGAALPDAAALQIAEYVESGKRSLGVVPTQKRVVVERFFDESGGMQLVVHAPFGSRINRAWGLALRKRFCVGFGFELQAAANEEAIVLSLGPQHSFELMSVFDYLHPNTAQDVLVQALLAAPMFPTRWRWNAQRSLLLERYRGGKRVPAPLLRMRADDLLAGAFPQVLACPETLPGGPVEVPMEHPIVRQTVEDCLTEAMDVDGFLEVIAGLRDGRIERHAVDTAEPSAFARGILSAQPYAFLDDAPLEERRTQAVMTRRVLSPQSADQIGALDPDAIARVREEAWPQPESAEEVHEALLWMGFVTVEEARPWSQWLDTLAAGGRVAREGDRYFAAEASRDPKTVLRGRLEALGPIVSEDPLLLELEAEGIALRTRIDGRQAWCNRRLLARIQRYTLERLRREIEPVTAAPFLRFLACWQHADPEHRVDGPRGVADVLYQLAGFEVPAAQWEASVLPSRVRGYKREWLDQLTLAGEVVWARLWGGGAASMRRAPMALLPRADLASWLALASAPEEGADPLSGNAQTVRDLMARRGASFLPDLQREAHLPGAYFEEVLAELAARGRITCDSFAGLRWLIVPAWRRSGPQMAAGRWSLLERGGIRPDAEFVARQMLRRTGVVFRKTLMREKHPVFWRDVARACRLMEARGEIRGGRFVASFDGEQYALPEAVTLLRAVRKRGDGAPPPVTVSAADPLNFRGILTPDERVSPVVHRLVQVG
jgi:ATP-dependent Lhr-like helicase